MNKECKMCLSSYFREHDSSMASEKAEIQIIFVALFFSLCPTVSASFHYIQKIVCKASNTPLPKGTGDVAIRQ